MQQEALTGRYGYSHWVGLIAGIILVSIVALVIGYPSLKLELTHLAIVTLGFGIIIQILFIHLKEFTGGFTGISNIPYVRLGSLHLDTVSSYVYYVWVWVSLIFIITLHIENSRVGRALRCIRGDELAASAIGIAASKYKLQMLIVNAIYCSIAGSLYAHNMRFVSPEAFGIEYSVLLIVMPILGGLGKIWGVVIGAMFFSIVPEILRKFKHFDALIYGGVLVIVVMYLPNGLYGGLLSLVDRGKGMVSLHKCKP